MTADDAQRALAECDRVETCLRDAGLDHCDAKVFLFVRRSRPRNWDRVRVMPGLYGRCLGELESGGYQVEVLAKDLRRVANKILGAS